ncbi:hypothetical protein A3H22_00960 [Candidatus Peribacteria bacterium RIFCSPLOWO2_12_FULL_55_15]|nr:MAG: hypothetical protein A2789_00720 [Candidatus Peribacteria bacterium RIFCSPHIGHO2_01_FULL_54_22]OGJ68868.1 MAG: hypothetical protein A2947_03755 [Candidatus Peribacteria bacterium RIFCSPLOWO2_01_FULL_54_110]OGJ70218.1 MAG: hypothetical protein A3H22_00960 [Candidatus Peribacteria bacterium RIFCSPLOWO2_12_FULL_55_15]
MTHFLFYLQEIEEWYTVFSSSMSHVFDPHIFRAYDIRGRSGIQITPSLCHAVGAAFGAILRERTGILSPKVSVGRDARISGHDLERALIEGLLHSGCAISAIGQTPSPVNYFTVCTQRLDGGIHVTASHNPAEDNGIKLCTHDAEAFAGEDIQILRQQCEDAQVCHGSSTLTMTHAAGTLIKLAIEPEYEHFLLERFPNVGNGLHIVIDAGNGVAGPLYTQVLRAVGCTVTELYTEPDGRFPNHPADPSKHETLRELQNTVLHEHAHVGFAFDGDGDRLGIVDERGHIASADAILLLLASDHLSRHPGGGIVFTVSNSSMLQSEIAVRGGCPIMCPVGHSSVERALRDKMALLGGEQSGHFFCAEEYFPFDDALVAALRVLSILQSTGKPLSRLFDAFPKVYQSPERRPHCPDERKMAIIACVKEHFLKEFPIETMDGVRIDFGAGAWAGIRQSNTSPCISVCMEARTQEKLKKVEALVLDHLREYPELHL